MCFGYPLLMVPSFVDLNLLRFALVEVTDRLAADER
jgi:hypothetical protein